MIITYLVGGWALPFWKIWVRQLGWWLFPICGKIKDVPKHQPVIWIVDFSRWSTLRCHQTWLEPGPLKEVMFLAIKTSIQFGDFPASHVWWHQREGISSRSEMRWFDLLQAGFSSPKVSRRFMQVALEIRAHEKKVVQSVQKWCFTFPWLLRSRFSLHMFDVWNSGELKH